LDRKTHSTSHAHDNLSKPAFASTPSEFRLCGRHNTLSPDEQKAGWTLLFDGSSTAGWVGLGKNTFPEKGWSAQDGTLRHEKGGGGGDIVSAKSYQTLSSHGTGRLAKPPTAA
jgi:hypothetical protein